MRGGGAAEKQNIRSQWFRETYTRVGCFCRELRKESMVYHSEEKSAVSCRGVEEKGGKE